MENDVTRVIDSQTYKLYTSTRFIFVIKIHDILFERKIDLSTDFMCD